METKQDKGIVQSLLIFITDQKKKMRARLGYAPQEGVIPNTRLKENAWNSWKTNSNSIAEEQQLIIIRNFNAKIGSIIKTVKQP